MTFHQGVVAMKALLARALDSPWLLAFCVLLYLGFVGPQLISATSTLAVIAGLVLLAAWSYRLLSRLLRHKE
jgi:ABC-type Na+ efflux pump permease subunit